MSFKGHQGNGIDYTLGGEVIHDTVAHVGRFHHIDFYENTQVDTILSPNTTGNSLSNESFPAGFEIRGVFTSIKLKNGACIAYKI